MILAKTTNHAGKCKMVYEAESILKEDGYFVFRRTSPHGLFHVIGFKEKTTILVQVLRLHSFNFSDINSEMVKIQDFLDQGDFPEDSELELWVWVNNKGWIKYYIGQETGKFHKYEDYGTNDFRKKK